MSFDPARSRRCARLAPRLPRGMVAERRYRASRMGPAAGAHQARAGLFRARPAQPPAIHRLFGARTCRRRSRWLARNLLRLAVADLDGAHRGGPRASGALRRPDDLRRISAIKCAQYPARGLHMKPMAAIELTLRVANAIGDVAAEAWDACANPARLDCATDANRLQQRRRGRNCPRTVHIKIRLQSIHIARFSVLAGAVRLGPRRGPAGSPCICSPRTADGRLVGAVPCYAKSHSQRRIRLRPRLGRRL